MGEYWGAVCAGGGSGGGAGGWVSGNGVGRDADDGVCIGADADGQRGADADGGHDAVDEGGGEAADVVHLDRRSGGGERYAHAGVAAEISGEQGVAGEFVEAAGGLLAVDGGVQEELAGDADAAGDHVEVGGGGVVVDGDGVLLGAEGLAGEAVVEVGVGGGRQRRGDAGLEAGASLGQGLADADGEVLAVGDGAVTEARVHGGLELALQEALLDEVLQCGGEVLDTHGACVLVGMISGGFGGRPVSGA